jgi:DNA modification methylase
MTPPPVIPASSIVLGERISRQFGGYKNLDSLASEILEVGLINPITLISSGNGTYKLWAGGRRFRASTEFASITEFHHGITREPGKAGYLLVNELHNSNFNSLITEIAENLHREDVDWRDELSLMVEAWKYAQIEAGQRGEVLLMRQFGATLGVTYADLQAANAIYYDFMANPDRYAQCTGLRHAYSFMLKQKQADALIALAEVSLRDTPASAPRPIDSAHSEPTEDDPSVEVPPVVINLSSAFHNCSGIDFMESCPEGSFDHIVTDPDYGVDVDRLLASIANASTGVAQASVADSLADLRRLIPAAYRAVKPNGFFVFFYDLDHHEKLQSIATAAGFSVQRWPLIWHKADYRSNAAPAYNFCKNIEYAMVCRKANATLVSPQMSSIFVGPTGSVVRDLNHPFAKPFSLWRFIYRAIATPNQTVFDPCVGSGSAAIAAAQCQLRPSGCEIQPDHYGRLIINLQTGYRDILKRPIQFT